MYSKSTVAKQEYLLVGSIIRCATIGLPAMPFSMIRHIPDLLSPKPHGSRFPEPRWQAPLRSTPESRVRIGYVYPWVPVIATVQGIESSALLPGLCKQRSRYNRILTGSELLSTGRCPEPPVVSRATDLFLETKGSYSKETATIMPPGT